jgi:hypothetical protein
MLAKRSDARDNGDDAAGVTPFLSRRQLAPQFAAILGVACLSGLSCALWSVEWDGRVICLSIGLVAGLIARLARQPWWRQLIHLLFAPLFWGASQLSISPLWYLAAFVVLLLVFRSAARGQIPLYPSGRGAARRLSLLLARDSALLDAGAGVASLLLPLARMRPDLRLVGIENAPLPWLIGWLRTCGSGIDWRWGDFWQHSLSPYQAVYCFLSPAPMPELWRKVCWEMQPGSLFISNAFPVPGIEADTLRARESGLTLYIYRIPPLQE